MLELLYESVSAANIVYTILASLAVIYMLTIILGVFDLDAIDIDFDIDADVDMDLDVDAGGIGGVAGFLSFFNLGKAPFMVIYCITTISMWAIGILANHYVGKGDIWFTVFTFIPIVFIGLIISKIITTPLLPFFKGISEGQKDIDYTGYMGILLMNVNKNNKSQADVIVEGEEHRITIKLSQNAEEKELSKGSPIVVVSRAENKKYYYVSADTIE